MEPGFRSDIENGRGGLGTNTLFAAGNAGGDTGDDANIHSEAGSRYGITVGSIQEDGTLFESFSTPGTSILAVAPGSNIISTDITGPGGFDDASGPLGADYAVELGTPASAPMVAGIIALMLQANPNLGWRDVQEILAYSAWNSDPASNTWSSNGASDWNGGGLHVSRDYGFGLVDARAAVRLAETWQKQSDSTNEATTSHQAFVNEAIPDNTGGSVTSTIYVSENLRINKAVVSLDLDHENLGDLIIELVSPDGTDSVILDRLEVAPGSTTERGAGGQHVDWNFTTTHDWGEFSVGDWTLRVTDAVTGEVGTVNFWSLQLYGDLPTDDNTYIYTDEFGGLTSGVDASRHVLSDSSGHDAINAAAVTSDTTLDLRPGATSQIAGTSLQIAAGTVIEDAYLGDSTCVTGNDADNYLYGGRGDDTLDGGLGADTRSTAPKASTP